MLDQRCWAQEAELPQLRLATVEDLRFLTSLAIHPDVKPFLAPGSADHNALEAVLARMATGEEPRGLMVIELAAGQGLGSVELALVSRHSGICQLRRLMVAPEARRRGIGTAAVRLACQHAFEAQGQHRVQAEVYGDNRASQRLFERLGFTREGIRRHAHWRKKQWVDGILFGLLAGELAPPDVCPPERRRIPSTQT